MDNKPTKRSVGFFLQIGCLIFALLTFLSLFFPVFKHQYKTSGEPGLGDFYFDAIIQGGLYDNDSDTIDPETYEYVNYSKMTTEAQYYYQTFVLLDDDEGKAGKTVAAFLLLALLSGLLSLLATAVSLFSGSDTCLLRVLFAICQIVFFVIIASCMPALNALIANETFVSLNFVVVLSSAVYLILAGGVGVVGTSLAEWILSGKHKKLFKK